MPAVETRSPGLPRYSRRPSSTSSGASAGLHRRMRTHQSTRISGDARCGLSSACRMGAPAESGGTLVLGVNGAQVPENPHVDFLQLILVKDSVSASPDFP